MTDQQALNYGFDRQGPGDKGDGRGFTCTCYWSSKLHGNHCPEHGQVGLPLTENGKRLVQVVYTNYKGVTAIRQILPGKIYFGSTQWHPEPQWLLEAYDCAKGDERTFALQDIRCWLGRDERSTSTGQEGLSTLQPA